MSKLYITLIRVTDYCPFLTSVIPSSYYIISYASTQLTKFPSRLGVRFQKGYDNTCAVVILSYIGE